MDRSGVKITVDEWCPADFGQLIGPTLKLHITFRDLKTDGFQVVVLSLVAFGAQSGFDSLKKTYPTYRTI